MIKQRQTWLWIGLGVAFIGSLYFLQSILMPFFTGLLVAYAMNPAVRNFEKWGISRAIGSGLMIISFFLLIGLLLFIAIPFIQKELLILASRVPQYGERIMNGLLPLLEDASTYIGPINEERLRDLASSYLGEVVKWGINFLAKILTSGVAIANLLSLIVITPIVAFYCLRDWNLIINTIDRWLPRPYDPMLRRLFADINTTIGGFAKGQALVCLMVGTYYSITLTLAGLDFGFVVEMSMEARPIAPSLVGTRAVRKLFWPASKSDSSVNVPGVIIRTTSRVKGPFVLREDGSSVCSQIATR